MELLQFIAGLAVLIFVHELGHFLAARLFKVNVEEFGIGFPPRLVKLFEHQGTEYTLNWIPLGGFVRMSGENDPEVPGGFGSASPICQVGDSVCWTIHQYPGRIGAGHCLVPIAANPSWTR